MVILFIGIIILVIFVVYGLGIGLDVAQNIEAQVREQLEKQKDQADPNLDNTGNFATDGKKICDLKLVFSGEMHDINPFALDPFNIQDDRFLVMGNQGIPSFVLGELPPAVQHKWFCPQGQSPFSLFAWGLEKSATTLSLGIDESAGEIVRIKFKATAIDNGKKMFDCGLTTDSSCFSKTQWQVSTSVGKGGNFPVEWSISTTLEEVTGDSYALRYWSEDYQVNGKQENHVFSITIPSP